MQTKGPNLAMPVPPDLETYTVVRHLLDGHGIKIRETLNYLNGSDLSLYEYYADAFTYFGVRNGRTYVTNKLEDFGDYIWVHPSEDCVKQMLQLRYPIDVKPRPEPATSNAASNKVLATQSPFKFEYAVHALASLCLNDLRSQIGAYIGEQRRMSSASSAYLYLTVTPEGEMRFTKHAEGQLYLQDTGEFTRDVKRMLAGKKPTVSLAPMPSGIPEVTEVDGEQYKTTRILNDGYYIGELETDELVYKDISVAEAIVYALNADSEQRFDALRVHVGDGHWKHYHTLQYLFSEADKAKYQLATKKVIRRVMNISGGMSCKIGWKNWDKFKDSTLRVSKSKQLREDEERYWSTPGGFFVPDKIGVELTGLYLFVK